MIEFSPFQSYLLYYGAILAATVFAWMAQNTKCFKKGIRVVNPFFWVLSFLCLLLPVAFRGYGVDHENYSLAYERISQYGWAYFETYLGSPEPAYVVVNIIANYLGDFQYVYIISAFLSLLFTYSAFARKVNEINLGICVWMFSTLFYLNLFGLVRMSIAVGIITYAYRYIEESNLKKYSAYVIFATLFHYSAIIMLPLYFLFKVNYSNINKLRSLSKSFLAIGVLAGVFIVSGYFVEKFQDAFWIAKYSVYFEGASLSVVNNIAGQYPLVGLMLFSGSKINRTEKYGTLYLSMFIVMIIFVLGSTIVSFMRLTFFLYPATYYLYAYVAKIFNTGDKILYTYALLVSMSVWFFYKFIVVHTGPFLLPYFLNVPF